MLNDRLIPLYANFAIPLMRILADRESNTAVQKNITNIFYILPLRISIIPNQKPKVRKQMAFVSGSTELCRMSFMLLHYAKRFTTQLKICKQMLMFGWIIITLRDLTQENTATEKHQCKHRTRVCIWQKKNC